MVYSNGYGYKPGYAIQDESWIFDLSPINKITYHIDINNKYVDNSLKTLDISYISLVKSFNYKGSVYVKLDIEPVLMQNILNHLNLGNGAVGYIVDNNGIIVAHPNKEFILAPIDDKINKGLQESPNGYYVDQKSGDILIFKPISGTEWKSVFAIPYEEIMGSIYTTRNMVIGTAMVCLLVSIIIIFVISSSLTSRIMKLKRALFHTGQGRISVMLPVEGSDEISALSHSYNKMLTDLKYSIERLSKAQFTEQQAVLLSLQSQIDSHFLYNTLEIINSMASKIKHEDIENITVSLAQMFRYTANYRFTNVTLQDEMNHLLNYLRIIEIRYLERFSYQLNVDESCMDTKCMKVILQPLAENAVKHGLNGFVDSLHIDITVHRVDEHTVEFLVSDNGIGFSEQRLVELREQLNNQDSDIPSPNSNRIGLLNIQHRLSLHYPRQMAKLHIGNNSSQGARVQILFPYLSSEHEGRKDAIS
jgi:two-component system sensor histidine kinase YesM